MQNSFLQIIYTQFSQLLQEKPGFPLKFCGNSLKGKVLRLSRNNNVKKVENLFDS